MQSGVSGVARAQASWLTSPTSRWCGVLVTGLQRCEDLRGTNGEVEDDMKLDRTGKKRQQELC